jgi:hypothetical protein
MNDYLLDQIDALRRKRNPFVHLKAAGHPDKIDQRAFNLGKQPNSVLEKEAKEALSLMYQIAITTI